MKIKENIIIDRAKEIVWEHVRDPRYMVKWNPRIKELLPEPNGLPDKGYKYNVVYEIFGRPDKFSSEIVEYSKWDHITIKHVSSEKNFAGFILEKFVLKETKNGTKLLHCLDYSKAKINFILKLYFCLLGYLRKPFGKRYLKTLKTSVEC